MFGTQALRYSTNGLNSSNNFTTKERRKAKDVTVAMSDRPASLKLCQFLSLARAPKARLVGCSTVFAAAAWHATVRRLFAFTVVVIGFPLMTG